MKRHITGLFVLSALLTIMACKKSVEVLTPSGSDETYKVPQGNNDYDNTIVDYYNKYGTYMLYKFTEKDVYWTPTGWKKPTLPNGTWTTGAEVEASDSAYINAQLNLIKNKWFGFYTDKFLKKFLPAKIMLCKKVDSVFTNYVFTPTFTAVKGTKKVAAFYNYDNIQVNYGDATVNSMTAAEQRLFIYKVNLIFMQSIYARGLNAPTAEFANSADYNTAMTTYAQAYGKGIIIGYSNITAQSDWNAFITAMVTYSAPQLNASVAITDQTAAGILNTTKDPSGQIKRRYNMVRNYFINEYGVDLQLVGNATRGL
ncbi:putative zinc-binding metallopeptidase [Pedobacter terrae]|uniref:putative zinc-binding metallopeptidase n=1 Tax=Pedobacter terrae TaxID=405671 RepID=UPI002FF813C1